MYIPNGETLYIFIKLIKLAVVLIIYDYKCIFDTKLLKLYDNKINSRNLILQTTSYPVIYDGLTH